MPTKKATTPRKSATSLQPSRAEMRRALACDLASILSNPETPRELYDFIADSHSDWIDDEKPWSTADELERALENHERKEAKRKGGARR